MIWQDECIVCGNYMYKLKNNYIKCSTCKRKFSKQKLNKTHLLAELFLQNKSAHEVAKANGYSYVSVQEYFHTFRLLCGAICQREYEQLRQKNCEYEEYFYITKSKHNKKNAIFEAKNFLTFDYEGHIYTILLPSLEQYKEQFSDDGLEDVYHKELKKFARDFKLINIQNKENNITRFWEYLEQTITHYRGIHEEQFGYFLKEFEFKYNHTYHKALTLLLQEYFHA